MVKLFYCNYWQKPPVTAAVHYFHYNSHHRYRFHHHCKIHLYWLKIILTIPLCNMIPFQFQLNFCLLFIGMYFSPVLFQAFSFFTTSKRAQNSFTTIRHILDELFILTFTFIVTVYTSLVTCLYLFTLTYLYLCSPYTILWTL